MKNENFKLELAEDTKILTCKFQLKQNTLYLYLTFEIDNEQMFMMITGDDNRNEILNYSKLSDPLIDIFPMCDADHAYIVTSHSILQASYKDVTTLLALSDINMYVQFDKENRHDQFIGASTNDMNIEIYDMDKKRLHLVYTCQVEDNNTVYDLKMIDNDLFAKSFAFCTKRSLTIYDYINKQHTVVVQTEILYQIDFTTLFVFGLSGSTIHTYDFL
jgi:hypothetical protein